MDRLTLAQLWHRNKSASRSYASVVRDAVAGEIPGVRPHGFGLLVEDEAAAMSAMRKEAPCQ